MQRIALMMTVGLIGLAAGPAHAADKCDEIALGDKAACKAAFDKECGSMTRDADRIGCERRLVDRFDSCVNGDLDKACEAASKAYWETCRKLGTMDDGWKERVLNYPEAREGMEQFAKTWGACLQQSSSCQVSDSWISYCGDPALQKAKSKYVEELDFALRTLEDKKQHIANAKASKNFELAMGLVDGALDKLLVFSDLARSVPWADHRRADLMAAIADLEASHQDAVAQNEALIASRVCPAGANHDAARAKAISPAVEAFFHDAGDTKVKVEVFRLNGPKTTARDWLRRSNIEHQPAVVCLEKVTPQRKYCQVARVTLRRTKVDGAAWNPWRVGVGEVDELLCKNVK